MYQTLSIERIGGYKDWRAKDSLMDNWKVPSLHSRKGRFTTIGHDKGRRVRWPSSSYAYAFSMGTRPGGISFVLSPNYLRIWRRMFYCALILQLSFCKALKKCREEMEWYIFTSTYAVRLHIIYWPIVRPCVLTMATNPCYSYIGY